MKREGCPRKLSFHRQQVGCDWSDSSCQWTEDQLGKSRDERLKHLIEEALRTKHNLT